MKYLPLLLFLLALLSGCTQTIQDKNFIWSAGTDMPDARTEVVSVAAGGKVYVIGGFNKSSASDRIDIYDTTNNSWSSIVMPIALHHAGAAAVAGKIYIVGGYTGSWSPLNKTIIYDVSANNFSFGADMPTSRGALTVQVAGGKIYAVGGANQAALAVNEEYNPETGAWTQRRSMLTAREHLASGSAGGKIYVIGGRSGAGNLDANEEYDPLTDSWTAKKPMPTARGGITGAAFSGRIYVFGGESILKAYNDNEEYDAAADNWTKRAPMPTARHGLAASTIGNKIYVIAGGTLPGLSVSNKTEILEVKI